MNIWKQLRDAAQLYSKHTIIGYCSVSSPVSIQTQSPALASSQSWLPLLRPSIPIGWRLRLLRESHATTSRKVRRLRNWLQLLRHQIHTSVTLRTKTAIYAEV